MLKASEIIDDYFYRGHFFVETPDGNVDDFNTAIIDYYSKLNDFGEEYGNDGVEALNAQLFVDESGVEKIKVTFFVYGLEYESGYYSEQDQFETTGVFKEDDDDDIYLIETFVKV